MASSNASSSNSQSTIIPDLGVGTQGNAASLRKPHSTTTTTSKSTLDTVISGTQSLTISSDSSNTQAFAPSSKFVLSPNAKEFVPKSYQPVKQQQQQPSTGGGGHHHQQQQHSHHQKSYNNGTNGTTRNRGNNWHVAEANYPPSNDQDNDFDDYYALAFLTDFINNVSAMPHVFDQEIMNLSDALNTCMDEDEDIVLQCIVNNIVDQAIIDPNFRYSGVRLCEHLIQNLKWTKNPKISFKQELLSRCQREHTRRNALMQSTPGRGQGSKESYLRGVTLFIADLSTKLTDEPVLMNALPDLMETLLSEPSSDNVKTVVLAMKVSLPLSQLISRQSFINFVFLIKSFCYFILVMWSST